MDNKILPTEHVPLSFFWPAVFAFALAAVLGATAALGVRTVVDWHTVMTPVGRADR